MGTYEVVVRDGTSEKHYVIPDVVRATVTEDQWTADVELVPTKRGPVDFPRFRSIQIDFAVPMTALEVQRISWAQMVADAVAAVGTRPWEAQSNG